jgi:hypothetical protein
MPPSECTPLSQLVPAAGTPPIQQDEMNDDRDDPHKQENVSKNVADSEEEESCQPRQEKKNSDNEKHDPPLTKTPAPCLRNTGSATAL